VSTPTGVAGIVEQSRHTLAPEAPPGTDDPYWSFYDEVARTQLAAWLPAAPARLLDLSGTRVDFGRQMASHGHQVVQVLEPAATPSTEAGPSRGELLRVVGDGRSLDWFAAESFDGVVAEGRALSFCLVTEDTLGDVYRVLRPGGRVLLCVDSLLLGLARLAEQHKWVELADVPSADVVLVEAEDGTITRCFWPEELRTVLDEAGLEVEWIRPRTVLSGAAVSRALAQDVTALPTLVRTEVALAADREGESIGIHLVASARRPR
jgi:SAM-dependent methyltransferase